MLKKLLLIIFLCVFAFSFVFSENGETAGQEELESDIEKYSKMLKSEELIERTVAVRKLSAIQSNKVIVPLGEALLFDDDKYIRRKAASGLGRYKNYKAIKYLISSIRKEEDRLVLKTIIISMGKIDDKKVIPYLEKFYETADFTLKSLIKKTIESLKN